METNLEATRKLILMARRCKKSNEEEFKKLIEDGGDPFIKHKVKNATENGEFSAFRTAAVRGGSSTVRLFLTLLKGPARERDKYEKELDNVLKGPYKYKMPHLLFSSGNNTLFHCIIASRTVSYKIIDMLFKTKLNPYLNIKNSEGYTPVDYLYYMYGAPIYKKQNVLECIKEYLLSRDNFISNIKNGNWENILKVACINGNEEMMERCLDYARDNKYEKELDDALKGPHMMGSKYTKSENNTLLHCVAASNMWGYNILKKLVDVGGKKYMNCVNSEGKTVLDYLKERCSKIFKEIGDTMKKSDRTNKDLEFILIKPHGSSLNKRKLYEVEQVSKVDYSENKRKKLGNIEKNI